jgi:hypothetical protein
MLDYEVVKPEPYILNKKHLKQANNEEIFIQESYKILKETMIHLIIMSNQILINDEGNTSGRERNEAILIGLLHRICRISKGFFAEVVNRRMDTSFIIGRSIAESAINLMYLIKKNEPNLYEEYVRYSLRHEKKLLIIIKKNIKKRGKILPIEKRMINSIERTFRMSLIDVSTIDVKSYKNWGGSIYKRFEELELTLIYQAIFGGWSRNVHGNWQDLLFNDLEYINGYYYIKEKSQRIRPQPLNAIAILLQYTGKNYALNQFPESDERDDILKRFDELSNITRKIDDLHEEFLNK